MNLEKLVCTPEQSRQFAELGLFEDSVFVWWGSGRNEYQKVDLRDCDLRTKLADGMEPIGPAPTAQELGEWLWGHDRIHAYLRPMAKNSGRWEFVTMSRMGVGPYIDIIDATSNEAQARAAAILQITKE